MIEVYRSTNTNYQKNGDITLTPLECIFEWGLDGICQIELTHEYDDLGRWEYLVNDNVIAAPTPYSDKQLFRIYKREKSDDEVIVYARHIYYDNLGKYLVDVRPTNKNGQQALDIIFSGTKFTPHSDITTANTAYYVRKNIVEAIAGDDENSFINRWGGERLYDNYDVYIMRQIGSDKGVFKTDATVLSTGNLDAGSAFVVGKDYYVYICDPGSEDLDEVYKISLNSTYPDGYNAETSRKIGGFHYGRVRQVSSKLIPINTAGAEKGSGWESNVASGIVPRSVWTLKHRPKCSPEGMVYAGGGLWVDIYLASSNGVGGVKSAYNATPLTGTEGHNSYDFIDLGLKSGKRLLSYSEWQQAAYGSPQGADGNNTNAWAATTNTARTTTGKVVNAVSAIGCVDCVGNVWEWLDELSYRYDGTQSWSWKDVLGTGNGQAYTEGTYGLVRLFAGGYWSAGVDAGCRAVGCYLCPWYVSADIGARFGCDSL